MRIERAVFMSRRLSDYEPVRWHWSPDRAAHFPNHVTCSQSLASPRVGGVGSSVQLLACRRRQSEILMPLLSSRSIPHARLAAFLLSLTILPLTLVAQQTPG